MKIPKSIKSYLQFIDFGLFEIHLDKSTSERDKICQQAGFREKGIKIKSKNMPKGLKNRKKHTIALETTKRKEAAQWATSFKKQKTYK